MWQKGRGARQVGHLGGDTRGWHCCQGFCQDTAIVMKGVMKAPQYTTVPFLHSFVR